MKPNSLRHHAFSEDNEVILEQSSGIRPTIKISIRRRSLLKQFFLFSSWKLSAVETLKASEGISCQEGDRFFACNSPLVTVWSFYSGSLTRNRWTGNTVGWYLQCKKQVEGERAGQRDGKWFFRGLRSLFFKKFFLSHDFFIQKISATLFFFILGAHLTKVLWPEVG